MLDSIDMEVVAVSFIAVAELPPLREDSDGALRVGQSRVLLELVIQSFVDGATPEAIVQSYPTLALADVYAVIAYYLLHTEAIEQYLGLRDRQAKEVRQRIDAGQPDMSDLRARLLVRRQAE